jgi:hypothetical protein
VRMQEFPAPTGGLTFCRRFGGEKSPKAGHGTPADPRSDREEPDPNARV